MTKTNTVVGAINNLLVEYNKHHLSYITEFIRLECAPDIMAHHMFPDAKEITESMGAFNAWRRELSGIYKTDDRDVLCIVVGDGNTPRTASIFAYRTKWDVVSIDPMLKHTSWDIDRLFCAAQTLEDFTHRKDLGGHDGIIYCHDRPVLIVCVHSHAKMQNCVELIQTTGNKAMIAIPCCFPYDYIPADKEYIDARIMSDKNIVKVWRNLNDRRYI
jgi:hypothetical protein